MKSELVDIDSGRFSRGRRRTSRSEGRLEDMMLADHTHDRSRVTWRRVQPLIARSFEGYSAPLVDH
jgi:hypothetical protein